jgi:hypothetical protein
VIRGRGGGKESRGNMIKMCGWMVAEGAALGCVNKRDGKWAVVGYMYFYFVHLASSDGLVWVGM